MAIPEDSKFCKNCATLLPRIENTDLTKTQKTPTLTIPLSPEADSPSPLDFNPGDRFSERYTIIEEIGRGGMGLVYKAKDHELGKTVALKMIRPDLSSRAGMVDHLRSETRSGQSVSHENVIRIHDLGEVDKIRYISMDFIKGENLSELIQTSGILAYSTCLRIAIQICRALRAAHNRGIIHQDLKPSNVMIDNSGNVFVMDFGLSKSMTASKAHPGGKVSGTPKYFSPEQARGEDSDTRSDIYSLGTILYEMVTGIPPFSAEDVEGYIKKHASEKPLPPSRLNPNLPPACEKIILRCLEKKREDRYQSAEELLQDLEIQKRLNLGWGIPLKKWSGILGIIALVLVVGWTTFKVIRAIWPPKPREQPLIAVMYAVNTFGDRSLDDPFRWVIPYYIATFLEQSRYLKVLRRDQLISILTDMNQLDEEHHNSKVLDEISKTLNVSHFVLPSFTIAGDDLSIRAEVIKAKTDEALGEPLIVNGKKTRDIQSMVEELSQMLKLRFDITPEEIARDYNQSLKEITSTSQEALRHYLDGDKYYAQRDYAASIKALELAVHEDPNFAMAYLKMADNYEYLDDYINQRHFLEKARTYIGRVSERDRYIIQGYISSVLDESPIEAIESYQKLLELYPKDENGRILLGAIYRNIEEWDTAINHFDKVLNLNPENLLALENKVFIRTAKGLYEEAIDLCDPSLTTHPRGRFFIRQRALLNLIQGRFGPAIAEIENALKVLPGDSEILELKGNLLQLRGELPAARRIYEQIRMSGEAGLGAPDFRGRIWLTCLLFEQGEYPRAWTTISEGINLAQENHRIFDEIDLRLLLACAKLQTGEFTEAAQVVALATDIIQENKISPAQRRALHLSGLAALGMGRIEDAKRISLDLRRLIEKERFTKGIRHYDHLMGSIALAEGRSDQAVRHFEYAVSLLPHQRECVDEQAFYLDSLARAYYLQDNRSKALEAYRKIISLTTGRLRWGDIYAKAFYWLGKIHLRNGDLSKAKAHFEDFLRRWNSADVGLPEVEDARKQLEALDKIP